MFTNNLVFIPKRFSTEKCGFIEGFHRKKPNFDVYYITHPEVHTTCKNQLGYVGKHPNVEFPGKNTLFITQGTKNIHLDKENNEDIHVTQIRYEYEAFRNSKLVSEGDKIYGILLGELAEKISESRAIVNENNTGVFYWFFALLNIIIKIFTKLNPVIKNCTTLTYIQSSVKSLKWIANHLESEKKFTPQLGNLCLAKCIDILLGVAFIWLCLPYKCIVTSNLHYISQGSVTHLRELLLYLMGSPIGLKLNYAFNHSLGKFFFYHINLWKVFLQAMQPILEANFQLLLLPALFGVSYQLAIICDIISLATFHVYCIYVYAARLFSLQVKGLISLWRLFIGRKFNPLRNRVDSCEYSSNQLFIGTLGFTLLLFLYPTTALYYTVFAAFRIITLVIHTLFSKLKDSISSIPLYIVILWIFKSSSIAGTLHMQLIESSNSNNVIEITLAPLSLTESIEKFSSTVKDNNTQINHSLSTIISRLLIGQLV
ncbi:phosphatidylinositol N-acetylglucosaminyltransferase subunit Q [Dendroctonus ponderosae]|uniref:phosphatidylinositol N-acetylglucosaminyltransferase subunit Q n=1 Tax=Dendroctonus ponderosae TaxID=77166 RepID=UPI002035A691|nr:phosphatidylinositol N-acetylglucosaminyltransferase subunit Q [Dendroctonus ponderosae]